jgi:hypothetical protein
MWDPSCSSHNAAAPSYSEKHSNERIFSDGRVVEQMTFSAGLAKLQYAAASNYNEEPPLLSSSFSTTTTTTTTTTGCSKGSHRTR